MIESWYVPQDFYDMIMALPDGADVTEHFECADPDWQIQSIVLFKTKEGEALLSYNGILAMEPTTETKGEPS